MESNKELKREILKTKEELLSEFTQKIKSKDERSIALLHQINGFARFTKQEDKAVGKQAKEFMKWVTKQSKSEYGSLLVELAELFSIQQEIDTSVNSEQLEQLATLKEKLSLPQLKQEVDLLETNVLVLLGRESEALDRIEYQLSQNKPISDEEINQLEELKRVVQSQIGLSNRSAQSEMRFDEDNTVNSPEPNSEPIISAYPNPFNPTTTLKINLKEKALAQVQIFNSVGQLVKTIHSGELQSGTHSFTIESSNWASGIYFYRLTTSTKVISGKLVLIK